MKIKFSFLVILTVILSISCVALIVAVVLLATRDNSDLVDQVCNDALSNGAFHRYASTIKPPAFPLVYAHS